MIFSIAGGKKQFPTKESVQDIINKINQNLSTIIEINLCDNVFLPEAAEALFTCIKQVKHLTKLQISRIFSALPKPIMMQSFEIVIACLTPETLTYLDISENAISCNFPPFFSAFLSKLNSLTVLKMNNCGLGTIGGNELAEALSRVKNKNNLMVVDLSLNKLISSAKSLGTSLSEFKYLEEISLQYNNIDRDSMFHFLESFNDHSLTKLDLRDNLLDERGCKLLGEYFIGWDLEVLRIGDCIVRDKGLKAFISIARQKDNLVKAQGNFDIEKRMTLDFSYNEITEEGLEDLEEFVEIFKVEKLHIEGNDFVNCEKIKEIVEGYGGIVIDEEEEEDEAVILEEKIENL